MKIIYVSKIDPTLNQEYPVPTYPGDFYEVSVPDNFTPIGKVYDPASRTFVTKTNETLSLTGKTIVLNSTAVVVQSLLRATELYEGINRVYSKANPPPRDTNAVQTNGSTEITGKQRIAEINTDKISIANNIITSAYNGFVISTKSMVFKNENITDFRLIQRYHFDQSVRSIH